MKFLVFTELFWDLRARVVTSHAVRALAASPSTGRNVMMSISSRNTWVLASWAWRTLDQHKQFPVSHGHGQDRTPGSHACGLGQGKKGHANCGSRGALRVQE